MITQMDAFQVIIDYIYIVIYTLTACNTIRTKLSTVMHVSIVICKLLVFAIPDMFFLILIFDCVYMKSVLKFGD